MLGGVKRRVSMSLRINGKPPDREKIKSPSSSYLEFGTLLVCLVLLALPLQVSSQDGKDSSAPVCEPACLNNGTCSLDTVGQLAKCVCPEAEAANGIYHRGAFCQTEAVKCNETWWCENGGTCLDVSEQQAEERQFNCSCPASFEGPKCQNPVALCGEEAAGLWCANGGTCGANLETNETICKCPSTHSGLNCQTLVEPQELGGPPAGPGLDSQMPPPSDGYVVDSTEDERDKYFRVFFWVMAALLLVWGVALTAVHWSKIRPHLRTKAGHMRMGPLNLKISEAHTDGPDVEDPINPHTPGGTSGSTPGGTSFGLPSGAPTAAVPYGEKEPEKRSLGGTDSKLGAVELVPAFSGSLEAEIENQRMHHEAHR